MAKISQESIERVAAANDIVAVIESYFPLKRAGTSFRALCPFHREKSPSFHVNPARQSFHCFGCGAGGGVFRFVMDYEHVDFPTAVRRLAQRSGVVLIEESDPREESSRNERSRLMELHRKVALWFHHNLLRSPEAAHARSYLKERGFTKEIAVAWKLGYAPAGWGTMRAWGEREKFSRADLISGGLLSSPNQGEAYDRFRDRLMFPICNDYGEVIGFSGRALSKEGEGAKYLNSPETPIFSKGRILFGLDKSKRFLIETGEAILMEGQIDLIAAFEHGCKNVVAPQGTAFTEDQARLLKRFVERVILCFDSDSAGQQAVERSLPALLTSGCEVRVATLPQGEDPDSMIHKQGIEAFQRTIAKAKDFFEHTIDQALLASGGQLSPRETATLAKRLARYLVLLPDASLREITSSKVATRLGLSLAALLKAMPQQLSSREEHAEVEFTTPKISAATEFLCRLALSHAEVRHWLRLQISPAPQELHQELFLLEELLKIPELLWENNSMASFFSQLSHSLQLLVASWDLEKPFIDPLEKVKDVWKGLQVTYWKERQAEATARLKKTGIQNQEILEIQKEILDLQQKIGHIL
ncbi:MAG: DNA primase [Verrucomicrobia bacterium RIFCSPHIGHO2_12_FULL_41_10]|nr:MAG: DNA primase [Verrucomicrobia bacterium RIFCSPHIGHO2_12_FULL_41_10]HLB32846.1 DNA primase [Chthoniobacterales bacterium]